MNKQRKADEALSLEPIHLERAANGCYYTHAHWSKGQLQAAVISMRRHKAIHGRLVSSVLNILGAVAIGLLIASPLLLGRWGM